MAVGRNYFWPAVTIVSLALIRSGAPLAPVIAGICGAALWSWFRRSRAGA